MSEINNTGPSGDNAFDPYEYYGIGGFKGHYVSPPQELVLLEDLLANGHTTLKEYLENPTYWTGNLPPDEQPN
jgi:hypothetical protein